MPRTCLLEIGFIGLPPDPFVSEAPELGNLFGQALEAQRFTFSRVRVVQSSFRLGLVAEGVSESQEETLTAVRGPRAAIAYDLNNQPTPAAMGFAAAQGMTLKDVFLQTVEGEKYLFVQRRQVGQTLESQFDSIVKTFLRTIPWRARSWQAAALLPQPPHSVCALIDNKVIPLTIDGKQAGREVVGGCFPFLEMATVTAADEYFNVLRERGIDSMLEERLRKLEAELQSLPDENTIVRRNPLTMRRAARYHEHCFLHRIELPQASEIPRALLDVAWQTFPVCLPLESSRGDLLPFAVAFSGHGETVTAKRLTKEIRRKVGRIQQAWQNDQALPLEFFFSQTAAEITASAPRCGDLGPVFPRTSFRDWLKKTRLFADLLLSNRDALDLAEQALIALYCTQKTQLGRLFPTHLTTVLAEILQKRAPEHPLLPVIKDLCGGSRTTTMSGKLLLLAEDLLRLQVEKAPSRILSGVFSRINELAIRCDLFALLGWQGKEWKSSRQNLLEEFQRWCLDQGGPELELDWLVQLREFDLFSLLELLGEPREEMCAGLEHGLNMMNRCRTLLDAQARQDNQEEEAASIKPEVEELLVPETLRSLVALPGLPALPVLRFLSQSRPHWETCLEEAGRWASDASGQPPPSKCFLPILRLWQLLKRISAFFPLKRIFSRSSVSTAETGIDTGLSAPDAQLMTTDPEEDTKPV